MEAIGAATAAITQASVVATTITHASTIMGQGGSSNLQRFKAHHPSTFNGGGEPMEIDHWFRQVGKIMGDHLGCHDDKASCIPARG